MVHIRKVIKSLEESGLLVKDISGTIKSEAKEKKGWMSWHVIKYIRC